MWLSTGRTTGARSPGPSAPREQPRRIPTSSRSPVSRSRDNASLMSLNRESTMSVQEIIDELKSLGNEATKRTLEKHGAREPFFGVKVEELKKIQKRIKKDYKLALELYDTGISDAMYLAGLIAD